MTSKRVGVTLTFATDEPGSEILRSLLSCMAADGHLTRTLESTSVNAFDLNELGAPPGGVLLVLRGDGAVAGIFVDDPASAHATAQEVRGVVTMLPVSADYRSGGLR